jgi:GntR family transcriptional regulator, transcriptional repressor for pyruvate dehydrogenase complex
MRQPRLAEMVADALRDRILSGDLADGGQLPPQEELLTEYHVSKPSLREALSILEIEGLLRVRRGRLGGSDVHQPHTSTAAYMLALVLQSKGTTLRDVGVALAQMEPICASLCAARPNRKRNVVPALERIHADLRTSVDDPLKFVATARRFHEGLVEQCGNKTLIEVVGVLEHLWSAHEHLWAERATASGRFPVESNQREGIRAHDRILQMIRDGDVDRVATTCRSHLEKSQFWTLSDDPGGPISAKLLRRSEMI